MGDRRRKPLVAAACAMALSAGSAGAASSDMDWIGIVYLWAADIGVDARNTSVDISFSDVVNKLEMAFQGHVEAQGEDFGGFVDVVYMAVGDNSEQPLVQLNADFDLTAMDLAMTWSPAAEKFSGLEAYAGLRYVDTQFRVIVDPIPPGPPNSVIGLDSSYYDFLLGGRYMAPIDENWRLVFAADVSAGDTEGTFSVAGYGVYKTGRHHFYAGYKHFEMDVEGREAEVTQTFSGPLVAYGFSF
jgi:hypothetical protein